MQNLKTFLISTSLVVFLTVASAEAAGKKTFVYCSEGSPKLFNPQRATDGVTFNTTRPVYNRLAEFKLGETVIQPGLAESWSASKDGLTYTFKLRKGVKFHTTPFFKPTREFNADDVVFSFERQRDVNHPFHKVGGGLYEYFDSMDMGKLLKVVKKVDAYTVQFVLNSPEAPFIANMAMDFASILSAEYADQMLKAGTPDKVDLQPVGTGPFILSSYTKDQMVRFKANPDYFKAKAKVDELVFSITTDPSVRFQKLKTGECHLITDPAPADLTAMKADPKFKVLERPGLNVGYLAMNVQKGPLAQVKVRQAINMALNKAAYMKAIYLDNAMIAKNPIPPTIWSYNDAVKDYTYNPDQAKKLLAEAGFPNGLDIDLWTLPVSRPYNPNGKKMGEMMQADLAKVGIRTKLVTYEWSTYLDKSRKGEHSLIQLGWTGDNGDPDNFLAVLLSCGAIDGGGNVSRWCDKEFDSLITQAKLKTDVKARTALYKKAQEVFKREAPWVPLAHARVFRAMAKNVDGFKIDPFGGDIFSEVDLK